MNTIKFANGATFNIVAIDEIYSVTVVPETFADLERLATELTTEKNLDSVQLLADDVVVKSYEKLALSDSLFFVRKSGSTYTAEVSFRQKTDVEIRLENLEEGQQIQDGAISDLGDVVSEIADSGTV